MGGEKYALQILFGLPITAFELLLKIADLSLYSKMAGKCQFTTNT